MLKTTKKDTLEEKIYDLDMTTTLSLSTYKELYRKYKNAGNEEKAEEYAKIIEIMSKSIENK
jgi:hypothetical protein